MAFIDAYRTLSSLAQESYRVRKKFPTAALPTKIEEPIFPLKANKMCASI
jgi:hypothetical protein